MECTNIAIVEDEITLFEIMKVSIAMFNFKAHLLGPTDDIAKFIVQNDIKLLILDFMMPKKNGLEIAQELRNLDYFKHFPLLMLTSRMLHDEELILIKKLNVHYMKKPFLPHILSAKLTEMLSQEYRSDSSHID